MRRSRGAALVELLIAGLLVAIAVSVMISSLLATGGQSDRLRRRELAGLQSNELLQLLKNYQTADASAATRASAPNCCWNVCNPPTACTCNPPAGPCPAGWALSACAGGANDLCHNVDFLLPPGLAAFAGTLRYSVVFPAPNSPSVRLEVNWNEP